MEQFAAVRTREIYRSPNGDRSLRGARTPAPDWNALAGSSSPARSGFLSSGDIARSCPASSGGKAPAADMSDAVVIEPLAKLARHVGWTVITQQPWPMQNLDLVQT